MVRQLITVVLQDFSHQFDFIVRLLPFDPDQVRSILSLGCRSIVGCLTPPGEDPPQPSRHELCGRSTTTRLLCGPGRGLIELVRCQSANLTPPVNQPARGHQVGYDLWQDRNRRARPIESIGGCNLQQLTVENAYRRSDRAHQLVWPSRYQPSRSSKRYGIRSLFSGRRYLSGSAWLYARVGMLMNIASVVPTF